MRAPDGGLKQTAFGPTIAQHSQTGDEHVDAPGATVGRLRQSTEGRIVQWYCTGQWKDRARWIPTLIEKRYLHGGRDRLDVPVRRFCCQERAALPEAIDPLTG